MRPFLHVGHDERYRANDIEMLGGMYADEAVIDCGCDGLKSISGRDGLRPYRVQRVRDYPAADIDDLQSLDGAATIAYVSCGRVAATIRNTGLAGSHCDGARRARKFYGSPRPELGSCGLPSGARAQGSDDGPLPGRFPISLSAIASSVRDASIVASIPATLAGDSAGMSAGRSIFCGTGSWGAAGAGVSAMAAGEASRRLLKR
jgi:hypothetical protein